MRHYVSSALLLLGLGLLLFPALSDACTACARDGALQRYKDTVGQMTSAGCQALLEAAEAWENPSALAVDDSGILGCLAIPDLGAELPVYYGTGEDMLKKGIGVWEGGSLPLGGEGCHSVLSGHRGLPESRLFRDLDRLAVGDFFTLTVLDRVMTYRVEEILTVSPEDTWALLPVEGQDLCTLVTCTPYGINSHRLLVRGQRVFL